MKETGLRRNEEQAVLALRRLYRNYGYLPYKMNRFEDYDFYLRNKDFLMSDRIITFSDPSGRLMALKPDVTLSIVKNAPEEPGAVRKLYYNETVYRDYREFMQTGLECVGDLGSFEIAEVVLLAARSLEALGGRYVLNLSHMGLVSEILRSCGLEGRDRDQALDCLIHKSLHGLTALCPRNAEKLEALAACRGNGRQVLDRIRPWLESEEEQAAFRELEELWQVAEDQGLGGNLRLDFSVGNHLGYYSGVVFRGYLEGIPASVLSGGQYDPLARRLGKNSRAVGFAVYLDRLDGQEMESRELDTLILHDGTVSTKELARAQAEAAEKGSVLVARQAPEDRSWKSLIRFEKGERRC